jgi:NAD(P)-dependent dehydrogenase (short-subunit alcohol dehydrogenase family)
MEAMDLMQVDLSGKVCVVTGAAGGIGSAIAKRFAANGATVVCADIVDAGELASQLPGAIAIRMNVTDRDEVAEAIRGVVDRFGRLDVMVNNAGINTMKHRVTIDEFPLEEWQRIVDVDLTGVFIVSHEASKVMRAQKTGRIINIASVVGMVPLRLQCAFAAAKAGVIHLTKAMAIELGPHGILVNAISPGSILTEGTKQLFYGDDGMFAASVQRMLDHVPLGRPGSPDEIAVAVLFLSAPENTYTTGQVIAVDGGWISGFARDF